MKKRSIMIAMVLPNLMGCGSWLVRQGCKDINWFEYGQNVAMSGRRLTGDPQVKKCRDAEFELPYAQLDAGFKTGMDKYCQPKVVYSTGKSGEFFNPELCDPGKVILLQQEYQKGLKAYCLPDNGFTAGSSGKKYQNICPADVEAAFLKEYRRGRKAFLNGKVLEADTNLTSLDRQLLELERSRNNTSWRLNSIPPARYSQKPGDDPYHFERDRVKSELDRIQRDIGSKESEKVRVTKEKGEFIAELATLQE